MSSFDGHTESYAAYQDDNGEPRLVPSSVLYFDLLGTTKMATSPEALEHLRRLRPTIAEAITQSQINHKWSLQVSTWFTDNAVVAQPLEHELQREGLIGGLEIVAADLMVYCWHRGFLGRGAITYGDHYMDDQFVFGSALVEAVALEKSTKWPRVTLGTSAVDAEKEHSRYYAQTLHSAQSRCLTTDDCGTVFVDHLGITISQFDGEIPTEILTALRDATTHALSSLPSGSDEWQKWRWAAEYQNHAISSRLVEPEPYLVTLEEVRHRFSDFLDPAPAAPGSPWFIMDRAERTLLGEVKLSSPLPSSPGVYAIYHEGRRQYVGATANLEHRIIRNHLRRSRGVADSALRRNVAELLGFGSAKDIKQGTCILTSEQITEVQQWLFDCEVAWIECASKEEAFERRRALKEQELPPLTKL